MAKFYYNGVLLPEIPSDVLANYPYCLIYINSSYVGSGYYGLLLGEKRWYTDTYLYTQRSNYVLYRAMPDDGVWTKFKENDGTGAFPFDSIVWSNHDIVDGAYDSTSIYFHGSEPVSEDANKIYYQIEQTTLTSFADQARRINGGTTDLLTPAQMLEIFENAKVNGTLDGLENGWDVMFYDENNEGLAFYSIKQGHTINPPVYNVKAWQTADGTNIVFPYTPTEDVIFYALNSTYADQLYEFYGIDKGVYPYLFIRYKYSNASYIETSITFAKTVDTQLRQAKWNYTDKINVSPTDDLEAFISGIMNNIKTLNDTSNNAMYLGTCHLSNFDLSDRMSTDNKPFSGTPCIRLDE